MNQLKEFVKFIQNLGFTINWGGGVGGAGLEEER